MRKCYTLKTRYNDCCITGQNWVECFNSLKGATQSLISEFVKDESGRFQVGLFNPQTEEFDQENLIIENGEIVFDADEPYKFLSHSFDFGDYTVTLEEF